MTVHTITLMDNEERYAPAEKLLDLEVVGDYLFLTLKTYDGPDAFVRGKGDPYTIVDTISVEVKEVQAALTMLIAADQKAMAKAKERRNT